MHKVLLSYILFGVALISCEKQVCCDVLSELSGRFEHEIPNCDNSDNPEINCTEWLEFVNGSEVDILYGGTDIVQRFTYTREMDFVSLQGPPTSSFLVTFIIKDASTLERSDNGDIWVKEN